MSVTKLGDNLPTRTLKRLRAKGIDVVNLYHEQEMHIADIARQLKTQPWVIRSILIMCGVDLGRNNYWGPATNRMPKMLLTDAEIARRYNGLRYEDVTSRR